MRLKRQSVFMMASIIWCLDERIGYLIPPPAKQADIIANFLLFTFIDMAVDFESIP